MNLYLISGKCQAKPGAPDKECTAAGEGKPTPRERRKNSLGGYSSEVPPLPIPNREVKLTHADGTAVIPWESR